uniref:Uncharacterized protein n=1 Tax=Oryza punctata TaxID=4537 RepID=A0A0E0KEK9_ORYPU
MAQGQFDDGYTELHFISCSGVCVRACKVGPGGGARGKAGSSFSRSRSGASLVGLKCGQAPNGGDDEEAARRSLGDLCGRPVAPSVRLCLSVESDRCVGGVNSTGTFGVQVASSALDAMVEGDSEVKTLFCLPVLATATLSGAVHLLEGVAIGALVQLHIKGILRVKILDSLGSDDIIVLLLYPS